MNTNKTTIVFTTLALNQTIFFTALSQELKKHGHIPVIISFHESSFSHLLKNNIMAYNAFEYIRELNFDNSPDNDSFDGTHLPRSLY